MSDEPFEYPINRMIREYGHPFLYQLENIKLMREHFPALAMVAEDRILDIYDLEELKFIYYLLTHTQKEAAIRAALGL